MTNITQDRNFRDELIPTSLLDDAITWIKNNLSPNDVFSEDTLIQWANDNNLFYPKED